VPRLEDPGRVLEIEAMLGQVRLALGFVPYRRPPTRFIVVTNILRRQGRQDRSSLPETITSMFDKRAMPPKKPTPKKTVEAISHDEAKLRSCPPCQGAQSSAGRFG